MTLIVAVPPGPRVNTLGLMSKENEVLVASADGGRDLRGLLGPPRPVLVDCV